MREDPRDREVSRDRREVSPGEDFGQADYSGDYGHDPERGGYRPYPEDARSPDSAHRDERDHGSGEQRGRSWIDRAGAFFGGREDPSARRRRGPSDRVLWAVIVERLEDERSLDLRGVEVLVEDAEVTLNGTVRRKDDKRRIEDIVDLDGIRHVQNNLRVRDSARRWF
jgi:hypothetical protein